MTDPNNIFNEINDLVSWMNQSNLFEARHKDNIKIVPESNNNLIENQSAIDNQLFKDKHNFIDENTHKSNKKLRCNVCKVKIGVIDELISTCKCELKHCPKHRMPEAHKCNKLDEIGIEQRKQLEEQLVKIDSNYVQVKI